MSRSNEVPYFSLLHEYNVAKRMNTEARIRLTIDSEVPTRARKSFVDVLAIGFAQSVQQVDAQYASMERVEVQMNGKASAPGTPPAVPSRETAMSRRIARAVFAGGGIDVSAAPELSTEYVGFELSPLRTAEGARFVPADGIPDLPRQLPRAGNAVRIDLLSRTTNGEPVGVVQEVKVGADSDPPIALLQALAYTATLCPRAQYARLLHHYGELPDAGSPKFDVQIVVAGKIPSARSRRRCLWHVMPNIISQVQERPQISSLIRRISGIRLDEGWEQCAGRVQAAPIDWANPG